MPVADVVEQIVMTLFDAFADLHAEAVEVALNNAKVIRAAELGKILAPVMEAQTSAQAKFENCVDAYLRDPVRAATTFAAAGEIVWRRRDGEPPTQRIRAHQTSEHDFRNW